MSVTHTIRRRPIQELLKRRLLNQFYKYKCLGCIAHSERYFAVIALHPGTGSLTAIDLTMCPPHLFLDFSWSVEDDQWGSDHYPLILSTHFSAPDEQVRTWQFQKADWDQFQLLCQNNLTVAFLESNDPFIKGLQ